MEIMGLLLISKVIPRICSIVRRKRKGKNKRGTGEVGHRNLLQVTYGCALEKPDIITQNKVFAQKVGFRRLER